MKQVAARIQISKYLRKNFVQNRATISDKILWEF